jgi:hypothetical protein
VVEKPLGKRYLIVAKHVSGDEAECAEGFAF